MSRAKVAIIGYYGEGNLGDEIFKYVFPYFLPDFDIEFVWGPSETPTLRGEYAAIILGAGDLLNSYFLNEFSRITANFSPATPRYAIGCGIPYLSYIESGELDVFDRFFIRSNGEPLKRLAGRYGAKYCHYLPDLSLRLPPVSPKNLNAQGLMRRPRLGFFPVSPKIMGNKTLFDTVVEAMADWQKTYDLILFPFDTSQKPECSDLPFCELMKGKGLHVICETSILKMQEHIATLDLAVCMRFHAHVLCMIQGIPFLSHSDMNKVNDFLGNECADINIVRRYFDHPSSLSIDRDLGKKLAIRAATFRNLLHTTQLNQIILRGRKRFPKENSSKEGEVISRMRKKIMTVLGRDILIDTNFAIPRPFAQEIASEMCFACTTMLSSSYEYGSVENIMTRPWAIPEMVRWIMNDMETKRSNIPSLDLTFMGQDFLRGVHRAGWQYVTDHLKALGTENGNLICDTFADRAMLWGSKPLAAEGILPYTNPWVGFLHHGPNEEYSPNNLVNLISNPLFLQSLPTCRALIVLSSYVAEWLRARLVGVRVFTLFHPTLLIRPSFVFYKKKEIEIVQVGSWYRNPWTIHTLPLKSKYALKGRAMENYFREENFIIDNEKLEDQKSLSNRWVYYFYKWLKTKPRPKQFHIHTGDYSYYPQTEEVRLFTEEMKAKITSVKVLQSLTNEEYDKLLTEKVVFLHLEDASAVNTVIECIASSTPLLVNRHPAVLEYLGADYPLFYDDPTEVTDTFLTNERVLHAHEYLLLKDKKFLNVDYFLERFSGLLNGIL